MLLRPVPPERIVLVPPSPLRTLTPRVPSITSLPSPPVSRFVPGPAISVVEPAVSEAFSPWTDSLPLRLSTPILRRADLLRRSLIPSLLVARRTNETLANPPVELFETAVR